MTLENQIYTVVGVLTSCVFLAIMILTFHQ
jgi:hypothetical protein